MEEGKRKVIELSGVLGLEHYHQQNTAANNSGGASNKIEVEEGAKVSEEGEFFDQT